MANSPSVSVTSTLVLLSASSALSTDMRARVIALWIDGIKAWRMECDGDKATTRQQRRWLRSNRRGQRLPLAVSPVKRGLMGLLPVPAAKVWKRCH